MSRNKKAASQSQSASDAPRVNRVVVTIAYDALLDKHALAITSTESGSLDFALIYRALEAARSEVLGMERQQLSARQSQPASQSGE